MANNRRPQMDYYEYKRRYEEIRRARGGQIPQNPAPQQPINPQTPVADEEKASKKRLLSGIKKAVNSFSGDNQEPSHIEVAQLAVQEIGKESVIFQAETETDEPKTQNAPEPQEEAFDVQDVPVSEEKPIVRDIPETMDEEAENQEDEEEKAPEGADNPFSDAAEKIKWAAHKLSNLGEKIKNRRSKRQDDTEDSDEGDFDHVTMDDSSLKDASQTAEMFAEIVSEGTEEAAADVVSEGTEEAAADVVSEGTEEAVADIVLEGTEEAVADIVSEGTEEAVADIVLKGTEEAEEVRTIQETDNKEEISKKKSFFSWLKAPAGKAANEEDEEDDDIAPSGGGISFNGFGMKKGKGLADRIAQRKQKAETESTNKSVEEKAEEEQIQERDEERNEEANLTKELLESMEDEKEQSHRSRHFSRKDRKRMKENVEENLEEAPEEEKDSRRNKRRARRVLIEEPEEEYEEEEETLEEIDQGNYMESHEGDFLDEFPLLDEEEITNEQNDAVDEPTQLFRPLRYVQEDSDQSTRRFRPVRISEQGGDEADEEDTDEYDDVPKRTRSWQRKDGMKVYRDADLDDDYDDYDDDDYYDRDLKPEFLDEDDIYDDEKVGIGQHLLRFLRDILLVVMVILLTVLVLRQLEASRRISLDMLRGSIGSVIPIERVFPDPQVEKIVEEILENPMEETQSSKTENVFTGAGVPVDEGLDSEDAAQSVIEG